MAKRLIATLVAAPFILMATAAAPLPVADLQCLIAMGVLQGNADTKVKATGASGALYFLGKITGENPGADLGSLLGGEARKLKGKPVQEIAQRCLEELKLQSTRLGTAGARVAAALK